MRFIAIALLALLVCTSAMAVDSLTDNYATKTGPAIDQWGVWVAGGPLAWTLQRPSGVMLQNNIIVTAKVELWERDTFDFSNVAFHFGRTSIAGVVQPISAVLNGTVQSNTNCTIDLWALAPCNDLTNLMFVAGSGFGGGNTADIPLAWEYKLASEADTAYAACTYPDGKAKAVAFPSGFGTDEVDKAFNIRITATPDDYQADGNYILDPVVVITPKL